MTVILGISRIAPAIIVIALSSKLISEMRTYEEFEKSSVVGEGFWLYILVMGTVVLLIEFFLALSFGFRRHKTTLEETCVNLVSYTWWMIPFVLTSNTIFHLSKDLYTGTEVAIVIMLAIGTVAASLELVIGLFSINKTSEAAHDNIAGNSNP